MTLRKHSKIEWIIVGPKPTAAEIDTGSPQRIADACELMAKNKSPLVRDLEYWKGLYEAELEANAVLNRSNAAQRGVITRMKREVAK